MHMVLILKVSIPQAVSTVATCKLDFSHLKEVEDSFNTASGKHCCNATVELRKFFVYGGFNTASGKHCCNNGKV